LFSLSLTERCMFISLAGTGTSPKGTSHTCPRWQLFYFDKKKI
jgi:hypothetical protein